MSSEYHNWNKDWFEELKRRMDEFFIKATKEETDENFKRCTRLGCRIAISILEDVLEIDQQKRKGILLLKGTRFTVAQLLAEIADGLGIDEIANDYDLDLNLIRKFLTAFSMLFGYPFDSAIDYLKK